MGSKISGSPPRTPRTPKEAAAPKPESKPVTSAQVVQSRALATRYTLDTNNLPFRSTEEVLEYVKHNLDAMKGKGPSDPKTKERIAANLHFGIAELENRAPFGKVRDQLYAARQAVSQGDSVSKPAQLQATQAIGAFMQSAKVDPQSSKWAPAVFEPAAQLGRFRGPLESLSFQLGRVYMPGIDAPNFREQMPNLLATMHTELAKVTLPTEDKAKQVFSRALTELTALVRDVVQTADSVKRQDIVASGDQVLETLARFAAAGSSK